MDPGTGLTILGTAIGGAKVLEKLLGPTADYLGGGMKEWTERRITNVARILENAKKKVGDNLDDGDSVPPRVLKEILSEGSFCDEELCAEYYGGALASARSPIGRDDRAITYLKSIGQLSTYEILFHYLSYTAIRSSFIGSALRPTFGEDLSKMPVFLDAKVIHEAFQFAETEPSTDILNNSIISLNRHDLVEAIAWGSEKHVNKYGADTYHKTWTQVSGPGYLLSPTQYGIDLYLWAMGTGHIPRSDFLNAKLDIPKIDSIKVLEAQTPIL